MKPPRPSSISAASSAVVQRQLDAYNARDLDAWLSTFSQEAEQFFLHGGLMAKGHAAIRQRMLARFSEPTLHASLLHRVSMENIVVDHELVTRSMPDGLATVEMVCIYEVDAGRIIKATYAVGQARPLSESAA
jgi:putative hydrolase of HD superfamily